MVEILVPMSFFAMITTIAVGRPIARAFARRISPGEHAPGAALAPEVSTRLESLETQVVSLSLALERSIEEQRFLTRLLSERAATGDLLPAGTGAPAYTSPRAG